jgi:hypothetical protein
MVVYAGWAQKAVAINQAQVALFINVNDATSGALLNTGYTMPLAGSIVGIAANLQNALTHVTLQLSPTIGGSEVGSTTPLYRVSMPIGAVLYKMCDAQTPGLRFAAGAVLGIKITTDANLLPAGSADLNAQLLVMFEGYEP